MERHVNAGTIHTFKELMDQIVWSWESPYELIKDEKGCFHLNKLSIEPHYVIYKMETYALSPGVFQQLEQFYRLLNTEPSKVSSL